jgi:hypothetical protein
MAPAKTLVALTSFACEVEGVEHVINQGQVVASNHPAVKGREELFEPAKAKAGDSGAVTRGEVPPSPCSVFASVLAKKSSQHESQTEL